MIRSKRRSPRRQRGTVTIMVIIALVPLIGILALAIDYGNMVVAQTALQNYVDAKALAHLKEQYGLPGPVVSVDDHVPFQAGGNAIPEAGAWRFDISTFAPRTNVGEPGVPAVRVPRNADGAYQISQPMLLGGFFGIQNQTLSAFAVSFVKRRHIVIIQDVSGSMGTTPMAQAQTALSTFVNFMAARPMPGDSMGLVTFSTGVNTPVPLALNDQPQIQSLLTAISGLNSNGGTNTELGLNQAQAEFTANPDDMADDIAILVTDGVPASQNLTRNAAQALCAAGVHLNTVLINTGGSGWQPPACGTGRAYANVPANQLQNILFAILSAQEVRLAQ